MKPQHVMRETNTLDFQSDFSVLLSSESFRASQENS